MTLKAPLTFVFIENLYQEMGSLRPPQCGFLIRANYECIFQKKWMQLEKLWMTIDVREQSNLFRKERNKLKAIDI